jgi:hypothetical protein
MATRISDGELRAFIEQYAREYPSQVALIQATVRMLWPEGPPSDEAERVVRACLGIAPSGGREPVRGTSSGV